MNNYGRQKWLNEQIQGTEFEVVKILSFNKNIVVYYLSVNQDDSNYGNYGDW